MNEQVRDVNALLFQGEPANISVDEHSGYTGYKPQAVVDAMNEVLFGAWGFEEVSSEIEPGDKGSLAVAQVRVWLKDVEFRPVAWGQNRVTRGDIGDARKGAQTDAIKKALSYFSIGARAYHGLLDTKKTPQRATMHVASQPHQTASSPSQTVSQPSSGENTVNAAKVEQLLAEYEALNPEYCGKNAGWKFKILRSVLQIATGPLPGTYSDDDVHRVELFLAERRNKGAA